MSLVFYMESSAMLEDAWDMVPGGVVETDVLVPFIQTHNQARIGGL